MPGPAWFAAAVPVRTKMPVPMIAPIPSRVRSIAVSVRLSALAPLSASPTSCSIDLVLRRFESIHPPEKVSGPASDFADRQSAPGIGVKAASVYLERVWWQDGEECP